MKGSGAANRIEARAKTHVGPGSIPNKVNK